MILLFERIRHIWLRFRLLVYIPALLFLSYLAFHDIGISGLLPLLLLIIAAVGGWVIIKTPYLNRFLPNDDDDDDSDSGFYDLDVECELSPSEYRKPQRRHGLGEIVGELSAKEVIDAMRFTGTVSDDDMFGGDDEEDFDDDPDSNWFYD